MLFKTSISKRITGLRKLPPILFCFKKTDNCLKIELEAAIFEYLFMRIKWKICFSYTFPRFIIMILIFYMTCWMSTSVSSIFRASFPFFFKICFHFLKMYNERIVTINRQIKIQKKVKFSFLWALFLSLVFIFLQNLLKFSEDIE